MNLYEVIEIINNLESRTATARNYYAIVVLATVGWLFGRGDQPLELLDGLMLAIGLTVFFAMNIVMYVRAASMLRGALQERAAIVAESELHSEEFRRKLLSEGVGVELHLFWIVHLVVDGLLLAGIFTSIQY